MRDDFDERTKRVLADRVGLRCANPDCRKLTKGPQTAPDRTVNIGVAAHITAASPGGKRYDPEQTPSERKSADNGIWLCQSCAKLIDSDEKRYPVALLKEWKVRAEHLARSEIESPAGSQWSDNDARDPLKVMHALLGEPLDWTKVVGDEYIRHRHRSEYTIKTGETLVGDFREDWTTKFPDSAAWSYYVEFWHGSTLLKRSVFVATDGGRFSIPLPRPMIEDPDDLHPNSSSWSLSTTSLEWKTAMLFEQYESLDEVLPRIGIKLID